MSEASPLPGVRLKAERERRGLSAQKAADEMHLDRWVIEALEADDYQRIGAPVYAKGHLKKYAALLGLPAAEIAAGFESQPAAKPHSGAVKPAMLMPANEESAAPPRGSAVIGVAGAVAVVLVAGVLLWRPWHSRVKTASSAPAVAAAPATAMTAPTAAPTADAGIVSSAQAAPLPAAAAPKSAPAGPAGAGPAGPAVTAGNATAGNATAGNAGPVNGALGSAADPSAAPVPGAGHARLRLSFSADSWVDVHDAAGKRTFAGNGSANSVKTLSGLAPMRVYLGFGSGVQLEINDRAVAIGPQFFAGDVARFEAGADGVLRRDTHPDQPHGAPPRNPRPPG